MAKTAIITGGSRGIGEAMSLKLGELGYNVVINYRSDSSKKLSDDIAAKIEKQYGVETLVVRADVSKFEDCKALVDACVEKFGDNIDVLVNNAGITNNCNWIDIEPAAYENVIAVNLMRDYCASKSGLIGLTRGLALEYAAKGVRVNAIAPGMIMTDMLRGVNQDELNALAATIPQGYIGDVDDIAGALEYLLTASYVTGQVISPNGGFVLS